MHCPLNYGAILQTYALQTHIESLGLKVGVIDYRPEYIVCDQSLMYVGGEQYKRNIFFMFYVCTYLSFRLHSSFFAWFILLLHVGESLRR